MMTQRTAQNQPPTNSDNLTPEAGQVFPPEPETPSTHTAVVHALRPGTWPASPHDLTLSASDVASVAASYAPERFKAPVVIGHPVQDDPAWGWVESAEARKDGLWLNLSLTTEMAELIRDGRYRTVSVSLWRPESTGNPAPGSWSLRHLGYLGATPPAVKGLQQTILANETDGGTVELSAAMNTGKVDIMEQEKTDQAVNLAERETALSARETALAARERELRRAGYGREIDELAAAGKVLPAEKPELVALMERLEGGETVCLAENDTPVPAQQLLRGFLSRLPARVSLGEMGGVEKTVSVTMPKTPAGYTLSERGTDLHTAAVRIQAAHNCDYVTAVRMVESGQ